jgi:hypothetical protein
MISVAESFVGGEKMSTIVVGLTVWLTLNAAFVALRLYVSSNKSSNKMSRSDNLRPRYPRLVRSTNQAAV